MRRGIATFVVLAAAGAACAADSAPARFGMPAPVLADAPVRARLRFEPNRGQADARVRYLARGPGYGLYLTPEGATLALGRRREGHAPVAGRPAVPHDGAGGSDESAVLSMRLVGERRDVEPSASDRLPGTSNYLKGNDPTRWKTGIEGYSRVRYRDVLPGVDVVYYGAAEPGLEYDLVLSAGVRPEAITVAFDGAASIDLGPDGSATIRLPGGGEIVQARPVAYQDDRAGRRLPVDARYGLRDGGLAFLLGPHDESRDLVIDPTLVYSTYLGGSGYDIGNAVAVDSAGNVYVAGATQSINFPTVSPIQGANLGGAADGGGDGGDVFVSKLSANGATLVYSTYLGGTSNEGAFGVAVNASGEAYVAGFTLSSDFPTAGTPLRSTNAGSADAFVARLNAAGTALVYSTYLGGALADEANAIAVDAAGAAYVTGWTTSTNFPTAPALPLKSTNAGGVDAFLSKLNAAGSALVYSTYLGGTLDDFGQGVALDGAGNATLTGKTTSTNFPTVSPWQAANGSAATNGNDAFVSKLNAAGTALVYSTYLGGSFDDFGLGVAMDAAGNALVTGYTESGDFPITMAALQPTFSGGSSVGSDAFLAKLSPTGSTLVFSTYLGGSGDDFGFGVAVDGAGTAHVAGETTSLDFPQVAGLPPTSSALLPNGFVSRVNAGGSALTFSTYLSGSLNFAQGVAADAAGASYVTGHTDASDFPTMHPWQPSYAGGGDAFIAKISSPVAAPTPALGEMTPLFALMLLVAALASLRSRPIVRRAA